MSILSRFYQLCWLVFLTSACTASTCYMDEGTPETMTSYGPTTKGDVYWSVTKGDTYMRVATCLESEVCHSPYPDSIVATLKGTKSTLTIKNVSRADPFLMENSVWICEWANGTHNDTECDNVKVYSKPQTPTCRPPVLNPSSYYLETTCTSARVYPKATCSLLFSKNNVSFSTVVTASRSYNHTELNEIVLYYKTECTLSVGPHYLGSYGKFMRARMHSGNTYVYSEVHQTDIAIVSGEGETTQTTRGGFSTQTTRGDFSTLSTSRETTPQNVSNKDDDSESVLPLILGVLLAAVICVTVFLAVLLLKNMRRSSKSPEPPKPHTTRASEQPFHVYDYIIDTQTGGNRDVNQYNESINPAAPGTSQETENQYIICA